MKTESTLYFDGRFWVVVIERHEEGRVRAVRIVFGAQAVPVGPERQPKRPNPKRAQRQASRFARQARPSTASQEAIHADRERSAQRRAASAKQKKREAAAERRRLEREKAKARHRGH